MLLILTKLSNTSSSQGFRVKGVKGWGNPHSDGEMEFFAG